MIRNFVLNFTNFCIQDICSDETTCICYFLSISPISFSRFYLSVLNFAFLSLLNFVFLITSLSTTSLSFFKSIGTVFNITTSKASTFVFKLFKRAGKFTSLLMSSLPTSAFKAINLFELLDQMYQHL